ncbi:polysaccharide biosynthesis protein [Orrella sp. 11846]|uniref:polysaccharide biosynthesis protein n=1 Tax=Orrella sp. 11846 TaxID=3409913 RepID=UPI003B5B610C
MKPKSSLSTQAQAWIDPILRLPRVVKRLIALSVDVFLCVLTVWFAFYIRLDFWVPLTGDPFWRADIATLIAIAISIPIFITHGFYRVIFRYSGFAAARSVIQAMAIYGILYFSLITLLGFNGIPRTIGILQPILLFLAVSGSRALASFWLGGAYRTLIQKSSRPKAFIYGAGTTGRQLAAAIQHHPDLQVCGFLDDDTRLQRQVLNGLKIYSPKRLPELVKSQKIESVLLALPSISRQRRNEILAQIRSSKVSVRTIPSVSDIAQGKTTLTDVHELDIDDLLGRESVEPDAKLLAQNVTGKTILVSGAGGSIGSEICRQIVTLAPKRLLLLDSSEFALYTIHTELEAKRTQLKLSCELTPLLGSVQDEKRVREIFNTWSPETIYHAAAFKHVPLVEHNPVEGLKNNVLGTRLMARLALEHRVSDFVLISTDKAVRPTNVMGASKRLAEMVLQAIAARWNDPESTRFSMVRFGNVLGSSGSVVPKFRQQIQSGGPVTITHPEITRYFMTIPEAAQLVIQAGAMAEGGDVFVLDMGEPVRILDLAHRMIELSGFGVRDEDNPNAEIEIVTTGLRPGEKLYEELLIGDNPLPTSHSRIMRAQEDFLPWEVLAEKLTTLELAMSEHESPAIRTILGQLVSGYTPNAEIVDWIHLEQHNDSENFQTNT